jgi:multisubunit Na+/H+ antiporter MnhB subunit
MTMIAFTILVVLVLLVILIYMTLAKIPGDKARERGHPQADAINVLGWIGLLLGLAPWVVALVWAHMKPVVPTLGEGSDDA